jgi:hypothetical protein
MQIYQVQQNTIVRPLPVAQPVQPQQTYPQATLVQPQVQVNVVTQFIQQVVVTQFVQQIDGVNLYAIKTNYTKDYL